MKIGVFGQPKDSAAKWAAEGNTFAYLYESEKKYTSADWAATMVAGGIKEFVLQDAEVANAAWSIPKGGIIGVVPGPPDPSKGGTSVFDEPERSGVTAQAFRDYAASLQTGPLGAIDFWMDFQGDKITGGPPNLKPAAPGGMSQKIAWDLFGEQLDVVGFDWHVAARGTYPVGLLVTGFERLQAWMPGKRYMAMMERGPQTASDNPRYLTRDEIVCQAAIAVVMGAHAFCGFYTRTAHKTRPGGFSFDPRDAAQVAASVEANAFLARFDDPGPLPPRFDYVAMIKDPNTALQVRDNVAGYVVSTTRMIDNGAAWVLVEVNCSHGRTLPSPKYGTPIPPLGVLFDGQPTLPPKATPAPPVDPPPPPAFAVTQEMWDSLNARVDDLRARMAGVSVAAAPNPQP